MNKRYFIIALIAMFSVSVPSFAAGEGSENSGKDSMYYKNSLDIGYNPGVLSFFRLGVYDKLAKLDAFIPFSNLLIGAEATDLRSGGTISVNYMRRLNDWLWLGGNVNYEYVTLDLLSYENGEISSYGISAIPIMAVGKAAWCRRKHVSLYSKLGIGVTPVFIQGGTIKVKPAVQLTPIGVEFGGNHVFGFVEGGFGLQGVLIAGMRFPF